MSRSPQQKQRRNDKGRTRPRSTVALVEQLQSRDMDVTTQGAYDQPVVPEWISGPPPRALPEVGVISMPEPQVEAAPDPVPDPDPERRVTTADYYQETAPAEDGLSEEELFGRAFARFLEAKLQPQTAFLLELEQYLLSVESRLRALEDAQLK